MSDDLLAQMTSALREEHDGATAAPEATRGRVIRALGERRPRRSGLLFVGIPLFVILGGSTAWAAATGQLDDIVAQTVAVFSGKAVEPPRESQAQQPGDAVSARQSKQLPKDLHAQKEPAEPAAAQDAMPAQAIPAQIVPAQATKLRTTTVSSTPSATAAPHTTDKQDASDAALLVFKRAHRAHFDRGDCSAALQDYARYLALEPAGSFAPEARYNRGVCAARLGQLNLARQALTPFANGSAGNYRQEEARRILDALLQQPGSSVP